MKKDLKDKWEKVYEIAMSIARLAPWKWLEERDLIVIKAYDTLDFYMSVMGKHGMFEGIMLCTSKEAICDYAFMQDSLLPDIYGMNYQNGILMVFNEPKYMLEENEEIIDEFMPRMINKKVIAFESFTKGYMPSKLTEEELDDAIIAFGSLNKALSVIKKTEKDDDDYNKIAEMKKEITRNHKTFFISYDEDEDTFDMHSGETPDINCYQKSYVMNDEELKELKKAKRNDTVCELEMLNYIPIPIEKVKYKTPLMNESIDKMAIFRYFALADRVVGKVTTFDPFEKAIMSNEEEEKFTTYYIKHLLDIFKTNGVPQNLLVRDEKTMCLLENIAKDLDIDIEIEPQLYLIDDFIYGLYAHTVGSEFEDDFDDIDNDDDDDDDDYYDDDEEN